LRRLRQAGRAGASAEEVLHRLRWSARGGRKVLQRLRRSVRSLTLTAPQTTSDGSSAPPGAYRRCRTKRGNSNLAGSGRSSPTHLRMESLRASDARYAARPREREARRGFALPPARDLLEVPTASCSEIVPRLFELFAPIWLLHELDHRQPAFEVVLVHQQHRSLPTPLDAVNRARGIDVARDAVGVFREPGHRDRLPLHGLQHMGWFRARQCPTHSLSFVGNCSTALSTRACSRSHAEILASSVCARGCAALK
jgi:hypothetical protein